jgi:hypothetical protein
MTFGTLDEARRIRESELRSFEWRLMARVKSIWTAATTPAIANSNTANAAEGSPTELCVTFVRAVGSFAEARKMLLTAEAFAGLKIR